ncbi:Alpha/Beta hydrolase protein [Apodospora peruviana]|uniref:Alpha/Beta hydrolase protein n=1 Tax=Apodospora peruviana TaxID=516989 RepID=A0AAE0HUW3_9PEZI|nr:Alpha/Beta hydrolase protein [Apodospora peruviana]
MKDVQTLEASLAFRLDQRFRTLFSYFYTLLLTPFLLTDFTLDIILCLNPWTRPSSSWTLNQAARMRVVRLVLLYWSLTKSFDRLHLRPGRERNRFQVIRAQPPKLYRGALSDPAIKPDRTMGVTWTPARPPPPSLASKSEDMVVCLHFHGGGFAIGNGRDEDTGYLAPTLVKHMGVTHVCTPQYRLSSAGRQNRFPAPVQDALTAYLALTREMGIPAKQIILSGDSAGANIAIGLLRYISEHGRELSIPAPAAVALWSPWVDVHAAIDQDMRTSPNYRTDYLSKEFGRWGAQAVSGYMAVDLKGPYLSPLHHPFGALKGDDGATLPMFVHGGEREVLCPDIERFAEVYGEKGWNVKLVVSRHCPHDIILLGPRIGFHEEAEQACRDARDWFAATATGLRLRGVGDS